MLLKVRVMLRISTFNIHKGFTQFNARFSLKNQRELLRKLHSDIVFLQEVQDVHIKHNQHVNSQSISGQLQYLAEATWSNYAYGKNAVYPAGHHGNAVLSKYPIIQIHNQNISAHASEHRGMLHCEIKLPNSELPLHTICVHLGLLAMWRRQQLDLVAEYIERNIPVDNPLIIAGDFNDWVMRQGSTFAERLGVTEVFQHHSGKPARSYPAWLPILRLDRIYVRGFHVERVQVHSGPRFLNISDHAILSATLKKT